MTVPPPKTKSSAKLIGSVFVWLAAVCLGYAIGFIIIILPGFGLIDCPECVVRNNVQLDMYKAAGAIVLLLFLTGGVLPFVRRRDYMFAAALFLLSLIPLGFLLAW
jgi:hypothetical protein